MSQQAGFRMRLKASGGLTLVELIVVVVAVLIALIALFPMPLFIRRRPSTRLARRTGGPRRR
jgi:Tfp pilus assembly protein FimT